jgi:chromosome segregation ATPase
MKEKPLRRTSKAVRETAAKELAELLPTIESVAAEPEEKEAAMKTAANRARVEKTMAYTVERVTREIGDLQLSIGRVLTDLSQQLGQEAVKLAEIRIAIDTENARLKELHDIDAGMVSLKAILEVAAERRAALEADLNQQETDTRITIERTNKEWTREQADHEARTKRTRERDEEEYAYKLSLKRRKEADEYASQQAALQKALQEQREKSDQEIEERQRVMETREVEVQDLQVQVERFPRELSAAIKQAEQAARSEAQKQAALDAKLVKMEIEAERNITALKIAGLEEMVKRQAVQLETMTKQLSAAQGQVQAMALKAIEGAVVMKSATAQ